MATTANTQRSTTSPRGNHPAGRALRGATGEHRAGAVPLRLVQGGGAAASPELLAEVVVLPVRPGSAAADSTGPAPLRLTRRGRRAVAGLALVGGLGLAALVGPAVLGSPEGSGLQLAGESSVVVQPGDTLWSIAGELAPDEDPRGVVDALQAANDLQGADLVPGQVLLVP